MSPAGDWESLRAAVANGADAVYFGLTDFSARQRAANFPLEELPQVMGYLHSHNVRGYVTCNTLIFSPELPRMVEVLSAMASCRVDAVIVQDLGLVQLAGRLVPGLVVHGSTQMTLTEPMGIGFVQKLGVQRVILARELSVDDIRKVNATSPLPTEVFVHGALCVAYSGQCLTSESIGGRSANRGQCAQACRLPYEQVVDGQTRDLGDKAYLLSPQDLAAHDFVDELVQAGVVSLKIEGRLKSAQYVAATTRTYRAALDAALQGQSFQADEEQCRELAQSFSRGFAPGFLQGVNHQQLVQGRFPKSRGIKVGIVTGRTDHGLIVQLERLNTNNPAIKPGDGVVFDEGHPEQDEQGGRVHEVRPWRKMIENRAFAIKHHTHFRPHPSPLPGGEGTGQSRPKPSASDSVELVFAPGAIHLQAVAQGAMVWKTDDPAVRRRLTQTYAREIIVKRQPVDALLTLDAQQHLCLTLTQPDNQQSGTARSDTPLQTAQKHPLSLVLAHEQLSRLGDTPFELREVRLLQQGQSVEVLPVMSPKSVLNELRRAAVQSLLQQQSHQRHIEISDAQALQHLRDDVLQRYASRDERASTALQLHVLVRDLEQLRAILDGSMVQGPRSKVDTSSRERVADFGDEGPDMKRSGQVAEWSNVKTPSPLPSPGGRGGEQVAECENSVNIQLASITCDFEDPRKYREAIELGGQYNQPITLATVRIVKPGEVGLLKMLADMQPAAILVRNLAALAYFTQHHPHQPLIGDYSLNVTNELTAALLLDAGLQRLTPGYDLNWAQLQAMLERVDPSRFELVLHQHMPMFHMEHCVFAHTLSNGKDHRDCGRPCDRHRVHLRDRAGVEHPLMADVGCRNTLFNGTAQSAASFIPQALKAGLRHYRIELLAEKAHEVQPLLQGYVDALVGNKSPHKALHQLRVLQVMGVTPGTLAHV